MLKRIQRRNHITLVLIELHWLKIHDIIIFFILLLIHNTANNTAPEYLSDLIRFNVEGRSCSETDIQLCHVIVSTVLGLSGYYPPIFLTQTH